MTGRRVAWLVVIASLTGCEAPPNAIPDGGPDSFLLPDALPPDALGVDGPAPDAAADGPRKRLDPTTIVKFKDPLVVPPVMPHESKSTSLTSYEIAMRQLDQQVLPSGMPKTTVWSYGRASDPSTLNYPAFTVEARVNEKVRVKWINGLVDPSGNYLPHLLPVDQTLHWANPPGPIDRKGSDLALYKGPVPMVTHVHGAHVPAISDGYPEAWYLPDAVNIPSGYTAKGTHYGSVVATDPGAAVFEYPNDQKAATLWYHDHTLGITRLNVYAGPAGFWLLRDSVEDGLDLPGPAPQLGDPPGTRYYEIPIAVQDRSFHEDGSLFYPDSRELFDGFKGPYVPSSPVHPTWNPEFFGDTIVVNGRTWPYLEVERRLYRLRFLNGCNSRFLILKGDKPLTFHQIGADGGLLPLPVARQQLLLAPAERADVVVDFSSFNEGDEIILLNVGPDEPFKGLAKQQTPADPQTTGQVMKLKVVKASGQGNAGTIPSGLPPITPLTSTLPPRDITLHEQVYEAAGVPYAALLGTHDKGGLTWGDTITETPKLGDTEIWRIINLTEDAHPIHLHLVTFQVLDRTPFDKDTFESAQEDFLQEGGTPPNVSDHLSGPAKGPADGETGFKDTVIANPGEVTRVIATFDLAGLYVWHCHILEHEDNEMMRPFTVMP